MAQNRGVGLELRHINDLALAGFFHANVSGERAHGGKQRGVVIIQSRLGDGIHLALFALNGHKARIRLADNVERRTIAYLGNATKLRASETGHVNDDDLRVGFQHHFVSDAQLVKPHQILNPDVALLDKAKERLFGLRIVHFHVQRN